MNGGWDYAAAREAVNFITRCKARDRLRVLATLQSLVANPASRPDAFFYDKSGRKVSVIHLKGFRIVFWVDHFAKEIRVTEIRVLN